MRGDEHRRVQHPVLLGASQLFAFQEENAGVTAVGDQEIRNRAPLAHFFDGDQPLPDRLIRKQIFDPGINT